MKLREGRGWVTEKVGLERARCALGGRLAFSLRIQMLKAPAGEPGMANSALGGPRRGGGGNSVSGALVSSLCHLGLSSESSPVPRNSESSLCL